MKNRFFIVVVGLITLIGCSISKIDSSEGIPSSLDFEKERIKSPLTGEVPSQLKFNYIPNKVSKNVKSKYTKKYTNTWQPVDDNFASLSISQICFDPNNTDTYYFCTGEGWFNVDAARGAGVFKSIDAGKTWQVLKSTENSKFYYCQDILVHPSTSHLYVTTRENGVMRSKDGGETWDKVLGASLGALNDRAADLEITADGEIVVSIGMFTSDGIYISKTGDIDDWTRIMNGFPSNSRRIEIATAPSNADVIYAVPQGNDNKINGVWKSEDKGATWLQMENPGGNNNLAKKQSWYDLIIEVDPNDENIVVAGGLNIWRSEDGCKNWQQITEGDYKKKSAIQYVHVDQHNVYFQNSDTVYFTNDGGIYRCDKFTADTPILYNVNLNYNVTQFYSCDIHPFEDNNIVLGGTQDNGSNISTDKGISEFNRVSWADGSFCAFDYEDPEYVYTTTQYRRLYRTYKGKVDTLTNHLIVNDNTLFINPLIIDATDPNVLYQASNVGIWKLPNARIADTSSWQKICRNFGTVTAIATSASAPNTLYIARSQYVCRIENTNTPNEQFIPIFMDKNNELPPGGYLNCIVPDDLDKNHLILVYSNYDVNSVYETFNAYDDDPTWVACEGDLPNIPIRWGCFKNGSSSTFYVATELGVYSTQKLNGSSTKWTPNNTNLPRVRVDMIKSRKSDDKFVVATHGRGIFTGTEEEGEIVWEERGPSNIGGRTRTLLFDPNDKTGKKIWAGNVSGGLWVVENIDSSTNFIYVPESTVLDVLPNPANNLLLLKFNEGNSNDIDVTIYNNLGQTLKHLVIKSIAQQELNISDMPNGIIYVRLKQGEEEITKKIIKKGW